MISPLPQILNSVLAVALLVVLLFNLFQRKHVHHGEGKRFATLYTAVLLLILYGTLSAVRSTLFPPWVLGAAFAAAGVLGFNLREKIFIFRRSCAECGQRLSLSTTLYIDDNLCEECRNGETWPYESSERIDPKEVPSSADEVDWDSLEPSEKAVLCYVISEGEMLLIHKKTGLGEGMVNAPGGRIDDGESPKEAAVREVQEEVGITPEDLYEVANLSFLFTNGFSLSGRVFFAHSYSGVPRETDEADPFWIPLADIPYENMWEDDQIWLPKALAGYYVEGRFIFKDRKMLSKSITTELTDNTEIIAPSSAGR